MSSELSHPLSHKIVEVICIAIFLAQTGMISYVPFYNEPADCDPKGVHPTPLHQVISLINASEIVALIIYTCVYLIIFFTKHKDFKFDISSYDGKHYLIFFARVC